jgi:hypothetical protein
MIYGVTVVLSPGLPRKPSVSGTWHLTPCTLHLAPCTLHLAPCTQEPTRIHDRDRLYQCLTPGPTETDRALKYSATGLPGRSKVRCRASRSRLVFGRARPGPTNLCHPCVYPTRLSRQPPDSEHSAPTIPPISALRTHELTNSRTHEPTSS